MQVSTSSLSWNRVAGVFRQRYGQRILRIATSSKSVRCRGGCAVIT